MRSFVVLLLLVICFLGGMLVGMDKINEVGNAQLNEGVTKDAQDEMVEPTKEESDIVTQQVNTVSVDDRLPTHFTQKTAAFLEKSVNHFYEAVVNILYQITQLFF
ncbi:MULTISPECIES: hypothetical protein [unclassified Virgibacillus]|uniref:hypothetical protein n=1 Tax=unclassified Virgibacillus TaxID=2620237 RepID=UPI0024DEF3D3|nr:hypothetical protein [Virgibacillus sp. LDC-1]